MTAGHRRAKEDRHETVAGGEPAGPRLVWLREAGPYGLLAETASAAHAQALYQRLDRRRAAGELPEVEDLAPGARSVLVPMIETPEQAAAAALLPKVSGR